MKKKLLIIILPILFLLLFFAYNKSNANTCNDASLCNNLKGKIILRVERNGEAYYINPADNFMYYLGRPADAFRIMREQGIGITTDNISKIPIGLSNLSGSDSDGDGLSDIFEDAIKTNKNNKDTDGDTYSDKGEIESGYSPFNSSRMSYDLNFSSKQKGKIFLQVEDNGEAWYVYPEDSKKYFLGRPADAFEIMRRLGLGISEENFKKLGFNENEVQHDNNYQNQTNNNQNNNASLSDEEFYTKNNISGEKKSIYEKLDGYDWSWYCWNQEVEFTIWKENIQSVNQDERYWIIFALSSDKGGNKSISTDGTGAIFLIYDSERDRIVDTAYGGQIPLKIKLDNNGNIINKENVDYC